MIMNGADACLPATAYPGQVCELVMVYIKLARVKWI